MRLIRKTFFVFGCLLVIFSIRVISLWPDKLVHYIQCDVGQGDAILLTQEFNQVLIDTGPNAKVLDCLGKNIPFWDRNIEFVIISHQDKDHAGGVQNIINSYRVGTLIWNGDEKNDTLKVPNSQKIIPVSDFPSFKIGDINFQTLWPIDLDASISTKMKDSNDLSIVTKVSIENVNLLLTGDIPKKVEDYLISKKSNTISDVDILKIAHHGSKSSSSQKFLNIVSPNIATIGVGKNSYGHPNQEIIERLKNMNVDILRTDTGGDIELIIDGDNIIY